MSLKSIVENNKHQVKKLSKIVNQIEDLADKYAAMSDEKLRSETTRFKQRYADGDSLDSLLPEAFAAIREADKRVLGLFPSPVATN